MAAPAPPSSASQDELNAIVCGVLPRQGAWSEEEYLWLTDRSRRLIEFTDGYVQELPMPTSSHQVILAFLYRLFHGWIGPRGGVVLFSALRLRVREGMFREPDLLLLRDRADPRFQDRYWLGADLVVEVVSPDRPERDLVDKRIDYAEAGIPEYWVVDPRDQTITVLDLRADGYVEHGVHARGAEASSRLLAGFRVHVAEAFDAPETGA
jgi:Uma2 family endonuclease